MTQRPLWGPFDPDSPYEIPDEALVIRLGAMQRAYVEAAVQRCCDQFGFKAFSVRAGIDMTPEALRGGLAGNQYRSCSGVELREAGIPSRQTGDDPVHYSVYVADGITDEVWATLENVFHTKGRFASS